MFGTYRTLLAMAVVVHHLISIPVIGHYAVHGFFILSGYLMTHIMNNTYGYSFNGVRAFAANRFLRLYPAYWFVLVISVVAIAMLGEANAIAYRKFIYIPDSLSQWLQNLSLIFLDWFPGRVEPRLSPPTWALTIELTFYLLIALGISRSRSLTIAWAGASVVYMLATHVLGLGYGYRYDFLISGTLPFAMGALIFHFYPSLRKHLRPERSQLLVALLAGAFTVNAGVAIVAERSGGGAVTSICLYLNYLINAAAVIVLIDGKIPWVSRKLDKAIGDYSYPLYLVHWQAGFVASMLLLNAPVRGFNAQGIGALLLALLLCAVVCTIVIKCVDQPIEKLRQRIKRANSTRVESALPTT